MLHFRSDRGRSGFVYAKIVTNTDVIVQTGNVHYILLNFSVVFVIFDIIRCVHNDIQNVQINQYG